MENLKSIKATAEILSSISPNESISAESIKTIGYNMMNISDEALEMLRKSENDK